MSRTLGLACLALAAAGCGLDLTNGGLVCSTDGKCPPGYHCASDDTCWKNGSDPMSTADDMGIGDLGGDDGGGGSADLAGSGADLSMPSLPDLSMPPTLTNGQICSSASQCLSHNCADGVCCDTACTENCKSCNQPTALGTCTPIADGSNPAHGTCGPDMTSSCGRDGVCDGNGACRLYGNTTVCKAGSCDPTSNKATADSKCDGAGHCITPTAIACDPYVCNGNVCYSSCSSSAQCKGGTPCSANQCGPKTNGSPCMAGTECMSTNCVDGVCCDTPAAMCGGCKQCNLASSLGTCTNVPTGQDPHGTCPASNANCAAGGCNGNNACKPAASTVVCATSCANGNQLSTTLCNGVSTGCTNSPTTAACPSDLVCKDTTSCQPNCSAGGDSACVSGFYCASGNCTAKQPDGQPCSANDQCTSGVCGSYHRDADGDGQGAAAVTMLCGASPPTGYVTNSTDCCDADANVKKGQTAWFTTGSSACGGSFDYDCSGVTDYEFTAMASCGNTGSCTTADPGGCLISQGWTSSYPACGMTAGWATGCNTITCSCNPPGECGGECQGPTSFKTTISKTQACH